MPVEFKDYYRVLGVTREAGDAEIKRAYRKLAGLYHPDVAKDKGAGDAKFKEVNEAHEVLSDPDKRRKYDELGAQWDQPGRTAAAGGYDQQQAGGEYHFEGTGFSDFFEQFFGSRGRASGGFGPTSAGGREAVRHGQDIEGDILVTLDEVLRGASRTIKLQRTDPGTERTTAETLQVTIPPGVREGQLIRLTGQGQEGLGGGRSGHLYLRVAFAKHRYFRASGDNLYHDLELTPWEAVLGAHVRVPTLDGTASLRIPSGTVAGREFRLRGMGLPAGTGGRGDLHVVVSIQVPPLVSLEQRAWWEKLAAGSSFNPRMDP